MVALVNKQHVFTFNDTDILTRARLAEDDSPSPDEAIKLGTFRENSFYSYFASRQRSMQLFQPSLLEALYVKGYGNLVVKLLAIMYEAIKNNL